ncbi:Os11g0439100 [Oryza sativa Japonica Group]|uniref:Os11g0439100 protein n=2 Tax=Oryza TaxID=4527 RepID=Q0ISZ2_ORYSJ|nr:Os11g0439100 [Oryza sativa Japonica Group]|eukprot:NP_001067810.2 Os11g0439100 [Oryza sativa Japonica Group]
MATTSFKKERWSLAGATALVTGGSKGIGNEAELSRCQEECNSRGLAVTVSACDVSVRADREALAARVRALFDGKLSILVNNVGTSYLKPAVELTLEETSSLMATNFESCFHMSQLAYPLLKASGRGNIINISSAATSLALPSLPVYSAAKG